VALAILFAATATAAFANSVAAPHPGGGWTVKVTEKYKTDVKQDQAEYKFENKATAETTAKYVNDMETAAKKGDKAAYDHAVQNLKALQDIIDKKASNLGNEFYETFEKDIENAIKKEMGKVPDRDDYNIADKNGKIINANWDRFQKDYSDYWKKFDEKKAQRITDLLNHNPKAKALDNKHRWATAEFYKVNVLLQGYEATIWNIENPTRPYGMPGTDKAPEPKLSETGLDPQDDSLAVSTYRQEPTNIQCFGDAACERALAQARGETNLNFGDPRNDRLDDRRSRYGIPGMQQNGMPDICNASGYVCAPIPGMGVTPGTGGLQPAPGQYGR
jgi:hypothetical protein